ncbi:MAG: 50S ribosomal protein L5 [Planctomycetota bacterium]|nr:MAG: 50S ribosomal protein L5 [Planctomycetota bacterium]
MARLAEKFKNEISKELSERFGYRNPHQIPRLLKIVVSMGVGGAIENKARVEAAAKDLSRITGQKALITKAKKSVAGFKVREGMPVGAVATLRGERMYEFLDRLISVVLPRIRDFQGVKDNFDGRGNFSLGLTEQSLFPEIDLDKVEHQQGMNVTFVTSAQTDAEGRALLEGFGMPFRRRQQD